MYAKQEVKISSHQKELPKGRNADEDRIIVKLSAFVSELANKFHIPVDARFDISTPEKISILLSNNGFIYSAPQKGEKVNARAFEFLKGYKGELTQERHFIYYDLSKSVFSFDLSQVDTMREDLILLEDQPKLTGEIVYIRT